MTVTDIEYGRRKKMTVREKFLNKTDEIIPLDRWVKMTEPYYPSETRGRPVLGTDTGCSLICLTANSGKKAVAL